VRVVQRRRRTCLAPEPFEGFGVGRPFRQELQGDLTAKLEILGEVHDAHAPAAEQVEHAIMRNGLPDHGAVILTSAGHR
jgi:hypothetical protein